jgi:hypothetical protein
VSEYEKFLASKRIVAEKCGRDVRDDDIHPKLYDFQRAITRWAIQCGRAAIFADCGLGKSFMQIEWSRLAAPNGTALILAPLAVSAQTIREGAKLGVEIARVRDASNLRPGLSIANYEIAHKFVGASGIDALVIDESSILKSFDGSTRKLLCEGFAHVPWRLACTATPCPNDIAELANHCEFLGIMKREEMLASFFVHDDDGWRLRGHATKAFYRWMASWAMAIRSPDDIGFDGSQFVLPQLNIRDVVVKTTWRKDGELFAGALKGIADRAKVRRASAMDRVDTVARICSSAPGFVVVWCGLNEESAAVSAAVPGAVEVRGDMAPEDKESAILDFVDGRARVLVTKPRIAGFGMNFQHASTCVFMGLSDSYEQYYQAIRRCWRYGQKRNVDAVIVVSDHEVGIVDNVRSKEAEASAMMRGLVDAMRDYERNEIGGGHGEADTIDRSEWSGRMWSLRCGDCCEEMRRVEDGSVGLSVFSPPFISLYTYTATERDIGNSSSPREFFEHFGFIVREILRATMPGRNCCVHVAQVPALQCRDGYIGLKDFRGDVIRAFTGAGWIFHGECCIDKDPQAQAIRTKSKSLLFVQMKKDSAWSRPAIADFVLVFRKPGENPSPVKPDITNEQWIEWARPIWYGISESDTLNVAKAKGAEDDRHICPLQLGVIERCVRLWSNPGDLVLSPFAGIGSEGYEAVRLGRRFVGIELKPLYARTAARNLAAGEHSLSIGRLFT